MPHSCFFPFPLHIVFMGPLQEGCLMLFMLRLLRATSLSPPHLLYLMLWAMLSWRHGEDAAELQKMASLTMIEGLVKA